jgi:hypothetical protein
MKIKLDNCDDTDDMVTVWTDDKQAAIDDQSIEGSRWEAPSDMEGAYAIIQNREGLADDLRKEGYEVDDSEWGPPD